MTLITTLNDLHEAGACSDRYRVLVKGLGGPSYGKDTPITLLQILDICGLDDVLWALRACGPTEARDRFARELACDYAAHILPIWEAKSPEDKRPAQIIEVARRFARGEASNEELAAASAAAWAAAIAATGATAWATAWVATGAATGDAAWDATWSATWAAARATAGDVEKAWQAEHLRGLLQNAGDR